jgi:hypothetical protein
MRGVPMTLLWIKRSREAGFFIQDKFTKYHSQTLLTGYDMCNKPENPTDRWHVIWFNLLKPCGFFTYHQV